MQLQLLQLLQLQNASTLFRASNFDLSTRYIHNDNYATHSKEFKC